MARMFPERLPEQVESAAERRLFEELSAQLDNSYTVIYSAKWLAQHERGRARPGEADFVIAHPERGLLVLEVKGGGIGRAATDDRWYSVDRYGKQNAISDPVEQAKRNYYALQEKLAASPATAQHQYQGGYAVAFPDILVSRVELGLDTPRNIVLDGDDMLNLPAAIERLYAPWRSFVTHPPGRAGVQALVELLRPTWFVRTPLALSLRAEEAAFQELTEEQFRLLDFLAGQQRALITGCAGSGKTFLAVEKARRLATEGFDTLLTCFNKGLAAWMRAALAPLPPNLRVQHFHELAHDLAREAGLAYEAPDEGNLSAYFNETLPELLLEATERLPTRFDAIVVDEGQDFREEWWVPLMGLLAAPDDGVFYVFFDERQCIYTDAPSSPFAAAPFPLTVNLRNTQAIHAQIAHHYDHRVACKGPAGRPPTFVTTADAEGELDRRLRRLLLDEQVAPSDIIVLTAASQRRSRWKQGQRSGGYALTWMPPDGSRQVQVATIHSFKGLERPVVILTELEPERQPQLTLVAYSRAKSELIVILEQE
jgi:hypothetical protein